MSSAMSSAAFRPVALALLIALAAPALAQSPGPRVETVAGGLEHPWGLAFLPDGRMLVTERPGRLRIVTPDGAVSEPVDGLPEVAARGQGGLLDVALHPAFADNRIIYLSYAAPGEGGAGTAVAHGALSEDGARLEDVTEIFRMNRFTGVTRHFGSRLVPTSWGTLFYTIGDRGEMERAQDGSDHAGSVIHLNLDGTVPDNNPFVGDPEVADEIWSIGHRNPQAAALHPDTGELWVVEHGARGGDEVNRPEAGKNYGWPTITYGIDYSGARIGEGTSKEGLEQPVYYWDPSIAPSGMAFYTGDLFPDWKGDLFVGALVQRHLARLDMQDGKVVGEERLLEDLGERIRDVRNGPDGAIYVLTDARDGKILRLTPGE